MPAGYGSRCEGCYWQATFDRRVALDLCLFTYEEHAKLFTHYAMWLRERRGVRVAAIRINKDATFLAEIAAGGCGLPLAADVLARFPPSVLTRHRLVTTFLKSECGLELDEESKSVATERRRIDAMMSELPNGSAITSLAFAYRESLTTAVDADELSLRSMRLYLRAAVGLLQATSARGLDRPNESAVQSYLKLRHGQRASLVPFLSFLGLKMKPTQRVGSSSSRKRVRAALLKQISEHPKSFPRDPESLALALQYFHSIPMASVRAIIESSRVHVAGEWILVTADDCTYHVPRRYDTEKMVRGSRRSSSY